MAREQRTNVPGDLAGEDADDNPVGGFGIDNPNNRIEAAVGEIVEGDVIGPNGARFMGRDLPGVGDTTTSYAEGVNTGTTVDPADLLAGEEEHPGARVGFTGAEREKRLTSSALPMEETPDADLPVGDTPTDLRTDQQA